MNLRMKTIVLAAFLLWGQNASAFTITSKDFTSEGDIPQVFTCEGKNISPELSWADPPEGTKSFAIIVHDPDAPREGGVYHWALFNLPATTLSLPQDVKTFPEGTGLGQNVRQKNEYTGPCPPTGKHRYYFRVFALDTRLDLPDGASAPEIEKAMESHILGQAERMGRYMKVAK